MTKQEKYEAMQRWAWKVIGQLDRGNEVSQHEYMMARLLIDMDDCDTLEEALEVLGC